MILFCVLRGCKKLYIVYVKFVFFFLIPSKQSFVFEKTADFVSKPVLMNEKIQRDPKEMVYFSYIQNYHITYIRFIVTISKK